MSRTRVGIVGTVGIPANYGGFETFTEQLVSHTGNGDVDYTVFCSSRAYYQKLNQYKGARLRYIPLKANGLQSILYDAVSLAKATRSNDAVLLLGVSGCIFLPLWRLFSKKKLIVNIDGLEHRRAKWGNLTRRFLRLSEKLAVRHADIVVADNRGIQDYVMSEYGVPSELIEYGGDQAIIYANKEDDDRVLANLGVTPGSYALAVSRMEPENNPEMILEAFSRMPDFKLIYVSNWDANDYGRELKLKYGHHPNLILHDSTYEIASLNALRNNCRAYVHGHSAGGTNPSLVEAMFTGKPILTYDCSYNRETTEHNALYFDGSASLEAILRELDPEKANAIGEAMQETAHRRYTWHTITRKYLHLFLSPKKSKISR